MLNQRLSGARKIVQHLIGTESSIDTAVANSAELVACMTRVRQETNLAAQVGHEALERASAALAKMVEARREIVAAHKELALVQGQVGLGAMALGGLQDKDLKGSALSIVENAA